ncbi:DUF6683 family protein [Azohydromonas caseinilytica]|uniref:DUF4124 domain-containing protein n=1 Tax=Azohydromonas caseinilytica TaxID=2728836 RepID=A0A848FGW2_9BURK|nr:DUF6683 family protein [Azohydromonas caseinilytica]NML18502.1 hypothetical protein [Azohydromonas caseinilytica]
MDARKVLAVLCVAAAALPLHAEDYSWASRDNEFATRQLDSFMWRHQRSLVDPVARAVRRNAQAAATPAPGSARAAAASTVLPERAAQVPAAMAAQYPPQQRARAQRNFEQLLAGYRLVEKKYGLPPRDLAGAAAVYLTGAYSAYRNVELPEGYFPPLVAQMRAILAAEPAQTGAPLQDRQEMYEQLAIVGMLTVTAQLGLQQQPDPALEQRLRAAGKDYLEQLLKVDAERVQLTERGLALR